MTEEPDDPNEEVECPDCRVIMHGEYAVCPYCGANIEGDRE